MRAALFLLAYSLAAELRATPPKNRAVIVVGRGACGGGTPGTISACTGTRYCTWYSTCTGVLGHRWDAEGAVVPR